MKWLYILTGVPAGAILAFVVGMYAASELGGEVVVLHRAAEDGSTDTVRLWVVEDATGTWIEHGYPDAPWIRRLTRDPVVTVERGGKPRRYVASADLASHDLYHRLRRDEYGLASEIVDWLAGDADTCQGVPVLLEPVAE